jgi:hypothetical protein
MEDCADRHPPHRASRVQETGRSSGPDGSIVTGTPLLLLLRKPRADVRAKLGGPLDDKPAAPRFFGFVS